MKVLVPVKRVVDYSIKIRVKLDNSDVDISNVKMSINPFDEIALEEAIKWKEQQIATQIIAISIGGDKCEETLRNALALGADSAIHIVTDLNLQPLNVAKILHQVCLSEKIDNVIMGKQAIDDDCNQTGQMLSALLDWSQACFVSEIQMQDTKAIVKREVDGGLETIEIKFPAIFTTDLRLNQPRYATLPNIMKARTKTLKKIPISDLQADLNLRLKIIKVEEPTKRKAGIKLTSVDELLNKIKESGVL